jgi:hypothetical protein
MINQTALDLELTPITTIFLTNLSNQTSPIAHDTCPNSLANQGQHHDGPLVWPKQIQGLILSAYYYGYVLTQVQRKFLLAFFFYLYC